MTRLPVLALAAIGAMTLATGGCTTANSAQPDAGGDVPGQSDAGPAADSSAGGGSCTQTGFTPVDQRAEAASTSFSYRAYSSAAAPYDYLAIELWYGLGGPEPLLGPGSTSLGSRAGDLNYATCSTCVLMWADCDDTDTCARSYLATGGTLAVTAMTAGGSFTGTLTNVRLAEVTIDPDTFESTPVAGGGSWCLASHAFDAAVSGSLPCSSSTDCAAGVDAPYCNTGTGECVQCLEESHCASLAATPRCDVDTNRCVECVADAHCTGSSFGAFCVNPQCGGCRSAFDCPSSTAPACITSAATDRAACGVASGCTGDDAAEDGDDGPAGARVLTAASSLTGSVCSATNEADYFRFVNPATGNVTFTLDWSITGSSSADDLDLTIVDENGEVLGESLFGHGQEVVLLTYLPPGTYYATVTAYDLGAPAAAIPYTLTVAQAAGTCSADADCAANHANQYLRGTCEAGACVFIQGHGTLGEGAACDSLDDCTSGLCTYGGYVTDDVTYFIDYHYMKDADTRGYCVAARCQDGSECQAPDVCSLGFCLPPCTDSAQCPIASAGTTVTIDGWTHATCNPTTGVCEF
jgi:hypothetical protein